MVQALIAAKSRGERQVGRRHHGVGASQDGDLEVVLALLAAKADVNAKIGEWSHGVDTGLGARPPRCGRALIAAKAEVNAKMADGDTALMIASQHGHLEVVRALIAAKAEVNAKNAPGGTALWWPRCRATWNNAGLRRCEGGCERQRRPIVDGLGHRVQNGGLEVVRALLTAKADVNAKGIDGGTPLMAGAEWPS